MRRWEREREREREKKRERERERGRRVCRWRRGADRTTAMRMHIADMPHAPVTCISRATRGAEQRSRTEQRSRAEEQGRAQEHKERARTSTTGSRGQWQRLGTHTVAGRGSREDDGRDDMLSGRIEDIAARGVRHFLKHRPRASATWRLGTPLQKLRHMQSSNPHHRRYCANTRHNRCRVSGSR